MLEKINFLATLLGKNAKLVITGSLALKLHGFLVKPNGIDLLISDLTDHQKELLDNLQAACPSKTYRQNGSVNYSFIFQEAKVDIWVVNNEGSILRTESGIAVANINAIFRAKKKINRAKDWVYLMRLSKQVFNPAEFDSAVTNEEEESEYKVLRRI